MSETGGIQSILFTLVSVAWVFVDLIIAGVVFYRFRASAAGLLLGGAHVLFVLKNIASLVVFSLIFRFVQPDFDVHMMAQLLFRLVSMGLWMLVAVGLLFVPRSLRRISERAG